MVDIRGSSVLESLEPGLAVQTDIILRVATHSPAARLDLHGGKDGRLLFWLDKAGKLYYAYMSLNMYMVYLYCRNNNVGDVGGLRWKHGTAGQEVYVCYTFCVWYLWLLQQRKVQWAASPLLCVPATFYAFKLQVDTWGFLKLLLIWANCILSEGRWAFSLWKCWCFLDECWCK